MSSKNVRAVALALLLFVYPIIVLSFASVRYTETIHRVSIVQTFDISLFGSAAADGLAALGFLALFTSLAFRSSAAKIASVAVFAGGIALYLSSPDILQIVALATLPALVTFLVRSVIVTNRADRTTISSEAPRSTLQSLHFGRDELYRVGSAFLLIIIILEIGAVAKWVTHPFFPSEIYSEGDLSWSFAKLESALFHSLGLLSPYLVVLIAFSFFYKWFLPDLSKRVVRALRGDQASPDREEQTPIGHPPPSPVQQVDKEDKTRPSGPSDRSFQRGSGFPSGATRESGPLLATYDTPVTASTTITRNAHWIILSAALIIAPLVMMYPHLPGVNPDARGVSVDEQYYINWMTQLRASGDTTWADTIAKTFTINKGDRPLTLLLILTIANLSGSPDLMVIRFLPVALAPALVVANYVLIRFALRSEQKARLKIYASIGAIFAALSPQIVVGEYAGFLSNWLALIPAYFALYFLIRGWESQNQSQMIRSFATLFAILVVMMLIHVYTWAHLLTVILLFGGISFLFARKSVASSKIKIIVLLVLVGTAFSLDFAKSAYFSTPAAAESESSLASNILPQDTSGRWDRLFFTVSSFVGGFLFNPVFLILTFLWVLKGSFRRGLDGVLLSLLFVMSLPIALGSIEFQTRVFYNTPMHIPAILAIYGLATLKNHDHSNRNHAIHYLAIVAVVLIGATYVLHAMANLYLMAPPGYALESNFLLP